MAWYLVHTKHPELRYRINKFDKTTKQAELQGGTGTAFTRDISEETLKKYGYKIEQAEDAPLPN